MEFKTNLKIKGSVKLKIYFIEIKESSSSNA